MQILCCTKFNIQINLMRHPCGCFPFLPTFELGHHSLYQPETKFTSETCSTSLVANHCISKVFTDPSQYSRVIIMSDCLYHCSCSFLRVSTFENTRSTNTPSTPSCISKPTSAGVAEVQQ